MQLKPWFEGLDVVGMVRNVAERDIKGRNLLIGRIPRGTLSTSQDLILTCFEQVGFFCMLIHGSTFAVLSHPHQWDLGSMDTGNEEYFAYTSQVMEGPMSSNPLVEILAGPKHGC